MSGHGDRPVNNADGGPRDHLHEQAGALSGLFEDLEQQAAGLHLAKRDAELADRVHGEYAKVTLASRLHASARQEVSLLLVGGEAVSGLLRQTGEGWCRVGSERSREWVVRLGAVTSAAGLSERSVAEAARPVTARLGLRSALRPYLESGEVLSLAVTDGSVLRVRLQRLGADFVECSEAQGERAVLVPFTAVAAVRSG